MNIGRIFKKVPTLYKCKDGALSDHNKRGACNYHRGLASNKPIKLMRRCANRDFSGVTKPGLITRAESQSNIFDVPLTDINIATKLFQNREHNFSLRSVENIVQAVLNGSFRFSNFDAIILWLNPEDNKLYILSGHSRYEAFKRLSQINATAEGRGFKTIPAKIKKNLTLKEAKNIALNSNTLSTKETDLERANYYRAMRAEGHTKKVIDDAAKYNEGSNASRIIAYSFLNPNGKTFNALSLLDSAEPTSSGNIKILAKWIGTARMRYTGLTDAHENEMFDFLIHKKGYGTSKGQISNENDFLSKIYGVIQKRTSFGVFDAEKPLNLDNLLSKTPSEMSYDAQAEELRNEILELEKHIKDTQTRFARGGASEAQILKATEGATATLARKRLQYADFLQSKGRMLEAAGREISLFDSMGYISNSGITRCRNGKWSSYKPYKGVCSHNWGIGKIVDTRGALYLCKDGTFSTHNGRGACMRHGGLKSDRAVFANRQCFKPKTRTKDTTIDLFRKETQGDIFAQPTYEPVPEPKNNYFDTPEIEAQKRKFENDLNSFSEAYKVKYHADNDCFTLISRKNLQPKFSYCYHFINNPEYEYKDFPKRIKEYILKNNLFDFYHSYYYHFFKASLAEGIKEDSIRNRYKTLLAKMESKLKFSQPEPIQEPAPEPIHVEDVKPYDDDLQRRIDEYNAKKQRRIERYQNLAHKAQKESDAAYNRQRKMWDAIPFGQPILVGHHSERRDRNYREKAWNLMGKSVKLDEKAKYYEDRANTAESSNIIQGDDPLAIQKLKDKLQKLKENHEFMKQANVFLRKGDKEGFLKFHPHATEKMWNTLNNPIASYYRKGFQTFELSNNSQNIKTVEDRIKELEAKQNRGTQEHTDIHEDFKVVENVELDRLQLLFDDIPPEPVRKLLKSNGFKWSPSNKAWQRYLNGNSRYVFKYFLKEYKELKESGKISGFIHGFIL